MLVLLTTLIAALAATTVGIPIDNGVSGFPEIQCGSNSITVNFNTQNDFDGQVFVKGLFNTAGCRSGNTGRKAAGIELPFNACNVSRQRSIDPRGITIDTTIIVTFHPRFITKVDRAYRINCFYMEADKTVSTEIEVSMLTTGFQTQLVGMPVCTYTILKGGPEGEQVQFALVGDQVYHKWNCVSNHEDTFCMTVHSCFVDDGTGRDRQELVNAAGCSVDRHLLNNLEYPMDLMAGVESHVFKYADRTQLYFQCQITLDVKEPNADCVRPTCPEAPVSIGRRSRSVNTNRTRTSWAADSTMDVRSQAINTIDALPGGVDVKLPRLAGEPSRRTVADFGRPPFVHRTDKTNGRVCLSASAFGLLSTLFLVLIVAIMASSGYSLLHRSPKK